MGQSVKRMGTARGKIRTEEPSPCADLPIGVFDSGVGGISVLREMVKILPHERFVFFGDCANAPFGTKSLEEIRRLTFAGVERLRNGVWDGKKGIKAVVIACNTATSAAIRQLRQTYTDMPVIGIEPALKPAVQYKAHPNVVVLATPATVQGDKFHHLAEVFGGEARVIPIGCPGLMEFVEQGVFEGEAVDALLHRLLAPVADIPVDVVVLGCTHYPFLKEAIQKAVGEGTLIMDGSEGTARQLRRRLAEENLLRESSKNEVPDAFFRESSENEVGDAFLRKSSEDGVEDDPARRVLFEMSLPGKEELCRELLTAHSFSETF